MPAVGETHDVRIGDQYYLIKPGTYRKFPSQQFGARFTTGDPDYNNLSAWQHWVQKCWVGGMGAAEWKDDAMYDEGVGIDSRFHEVMVLSRDLGPTAGRTGWMAHDDTTPGYAKRFFEWKGSLYCLNFGPTSGGAAYLYRFVDVNTGFTLVKTFTERVRSFAVWQDNVYFGDQGIDISIMQGTPGSETWITRSKPSGETDVPYAMAVYKDRLYVDFGTSIWRRKPDGTWDGSTAFYTDNAINYISHMEVHQGFLYMASQNGHILRTDGNNTFDMWQLEAAIHGIKSFDGRLFILAGETVSGYNNDPVEGGLTSELVMYQFSGAAVTELKRWGRVGKYIRGSGMRVINGKLFFGASSLLGMGDGDGGFGIAMYDPVEDAFHLVASQRDTVAYSPGTNDINDWVSDVYLLGSRLFAATGGHGIFNTKFTYRDMERLEATYDNSAAGLSEASKNGGWFESSDFDAGTPGLNKLWDAIIIEADIPDVSCSLYVEYSLDGGLTWIDQGSVTSGATPVGSTRKVKAYRLMKQGLARVEGPRFKYRITLRTTDTAYSPVLRGVAVRYVPIPEPNWQWAMTVVVSDKMALHDRTTELWDATKVTDLRDAFRNQDIVFFQEPGGTTTGAVLIDSMEEFIPSLTAQDATHPREYEIRLLLREMVQDYTVLDPGV